MYIIKLWRYYLKHKDLDEDIQNYVLESKARVDRINSKHSRPSQNKLRFRGCISKNKLKV